MTLRTNCFLFTNPVRWRLVSEPGRWRWSNYNWYAGESDALLVMDEFDGAVSS